jgi:RNA binding exosome subunit
MSRSFLSTMVVALVLALGAVAVWATSAGASKSTPTGPVGQRVGVLAARYETVRENVSAESVAIKATLAAHPGHGRCIEAVGGAFRPEMGAFLADVPGAVARLKKEVAEGHHGNGGLIGKVDGELEAAEAAVQSAAGGLGACFASGPGNGAASAAAGESAEPVGRRVERLTSEYQDLREGFEIKLEFIRESKATNPCFGEVEPILLRAMERLTTKVTGPLAQLQKEVAEGHHGSDELIAVVTEDLAAGEARQREVIKDMEICIR